MQHYVYSFLLICFIRFVLAEWVRVGDLVVRFNSAMSARCPRCVFCGKRDAAASTIGATASPELPRMQRVTLPVQALHSLAEIRILTGGLQAHSGFFRFCLFLRLSVVDVPLCAAQFRVQRFRWQHVAHELWDGDDELGAGGDDIAPTANWRVQTHLIRRMFVEDRMANANAARRAGDAHKHYELIYIYSSNNNNKNYSY